jgi:hypothetical protein
MTEQKPLIKEIKLEGLKSYLAFSILVKKGKLALFLQKKKEIKDEDLDILVKKSDEEREEMLTNLIYTIGLDAEEVIAVCGLATDANNVPYSVNQLNNLKAIEIAYILREVFRKIYDLNVF